MLLGGAMANRRESFEARGPASGLATSMRLQAVATVPALAGNVPPL